MKAAKETTCVTYVKIGWGMNLFKIKKIHVIKIEPIIQDDFFLAKVGEGSKYWPYHTGIFP